MMVQSALNILGSTLVAAFTAASKIEQVVTQAYVAMGTTMATYGAQNIGAGNVPRIRQGFKACTILGIGYSLVAATFIMTVGKYMTYLFVSEDVDIIMSSVDIYLKCIGLFFIPLIFILPYFFGLLGVEMCQMWADCCSFAVAVPIAWSAFRDMRREKMELG